jgi:hypothetical protein
VPTRSAGGGLEGTIAAELVMATGSSNDVHMSVMSGGRSRQVNCAGWSCRTHAGCQCLVWCRCGRHGCMLVLPLPDMVNLD